MPPSQWTSTELGRHDKGTEEGVIRATKGTKDVSLRSGKREVHSPTDPPTETPHHEEHASNAGRWGTSREIAQGERNKKGSTLSTMMITSRLASRPPPYLETT